MYKLHADVVPRLHLHRRLEPLDRPGRIMRDGTRHCLLSRLWEEEHRRGELFIGRHPLDVIHLISEPSIRAVVVADLGAAVPGRRFVSRPSLLQPDLVAVVTVLLVDAFAVVVDLFVGRDMRQRDALTVLCWTGSHQAARIAAAQAVIVQLTVFAVDVIAVVVRRRRQDVVVDVDVVRHVVPF